MKFTKLFIGLDYVGYNLTSNRGTAGPALHSDPGFRTLCAVHFGSDNIIQKDVHSCAEI